MPRRAIQPLYASEEQDKLAKLPGRPNKRDLPLYSLIPFRPPLISRVCKGSRAKARKYGEYTRVAVEVGPETLTSAGSIWLNKR